PKLLIVEDNFEMRVFIKQVLNDSYQILEASDGKQGFDMTLEHSPDIIVSDVMMPNMDGFQLVEAIRSEMAVSHIPIVLLTAKGDRESKLKGLSDLADDYITKPFDEIELRQRLSNLLGLRAILQTRFSRGYLQPDYQPGSVNLDSNQPEALLNTDITRKRKGELLDGPVETNLLTDKDRAFLKCFKQIIETDHGNSELSISMVSDQLAMSDRQLQRKLKAVSGSSFSDLLRGYRLERGGELLKENANDLQVAVIADRVGFNSSNYFVRCFKARYGQTPTEYRTAD
ncbi:MAG: response regulator, partial [Kangiellaceae bacterium]|nr:response regulator [Kangiellaceae bacterium]